MTAAETSTALQGLKTLICASETWQTYVGAAGASAAAASVFLLEHEDAPSELTGNRPFIVAFPGAWKRVPTSGGARQNFDTTSTITMRCAGGYSGELIDQSGREAAGLAFIDAMESMIDDILDYPDLFSVLELRSIERTGGPYRPKTIDEPTAGAYWWADFLVTWGPAG